MTENPDGKAASASSSPALRLAGLALAAALLGAGGYLAYDRLLAAKDASGAAESATAGNAVPTGGMAHELERPKVPETRPEFTLKNLKGEPVAMSHWQGKAVVVNFWATWCGPCRQIAPLIDELAVKYEGKVKVGKVDIDQNQDLAEKYGINAIPTLLLFKDGEIIERFQGVPPRVKLESALDSSI